MSTALLQQSIALTVQTVHAISAVQTEVSILKRERDANIYHTLLLSVVLCFGSEAVLGNWILTVNLEQLFWDCSPVGERPFHHLPLAN